MNKKSLLSAIAAALVSFATPAGAANAVDKPEAKFTVYRSEPGKAKAMLERAVEYMNGNSTERAFAAFNNQRGSFHENDLYVFVVGMRDGIMHAHGGAPEGIVGEPVLDLKDAQGKPIIREMLQVVEREGSGKVDYVWLNRMTNRVENKTSMVTRVGDYLLGVGYYAK